MKEIILKIVLFLSSISKGRYAGKMIGFFDYCRKVVCGNKDCFAGQIHQRMSLVNILPHDITDVIEIESTDRIKLRIVYPIGYSWNQVQSLYDAFVDDNRFQTIVLVNNEIRQRSLLEQNGCKYITLDQYKLIEDNPDILITTYYSHSDTSISFPGCHQYINKVYGVIPNAVMNEKNNDIHWNYIKNAYKFLTPDCYIVDRLVYDALKSYVKDSKLVEMGNPQYDAIYYEKEANRPSPDSWRKLQGKKVFLWATDHGINESYAKNGFTVDLYLSSMLKYFANHQEIGLIFRPHPQFIREMLKDGHFWRHEDILQLKKYMDSTPNVVWDDTDSFCFAYNTCNAIIVDANCSITCSALVLDKPICRLLRYDIKEWLISPELLDCYYYAHDFHECEEFISMVKKDLDPKSDLRKLGMGKAIVHFDGKNGKRMKEFITNDYLSKYKQ